MPSFGGHQELKRSPHSSDSDSRSSGSHAKGPRMKKSYSSASIAPLQPQEEKGSDSRDMAQLARRELALDDDY